MADWPESAMREALAGRARILGSIESRFRPAPITDAAIRQALLRPIWPEGSGSAIPELVKPGESVCIVVSDNTRRTAADRVLPVLLDVLTAAGCSAADMFILFATGIHRHPNPDEVRRILGETVASEFTGRIRFHYPDEPSELARVGVTRRGNEVWINRLAVESDRLLLIGAATYHYHAGFGGGRKSLVPGLASRQTIARNHSLTLDPKQDRIYPNVGPGLLDGNPVAEEMLESARLCNPDAIVNTVLGTDGELVGVFAGDLDAAHRAACQLLEQVVRVDIAEQADLVVASAGAAPNWVQSHKALFNAHRAVRPGGYVVLLAPCPEGLGDERLRYWLRKPSVDAIYRGLRENPEVLGQTALSTRERGRRTVLVTSMPACDTADLGIETAPDARLAVEIALDRIAAQGVAGPTCWLMPRASALVPFYRI